MCSPQSETAHNYIISSAKCQHVQPTNVPMVFHSLVLRLDGLICGSCLPPNVGSPATCTNSDGFYHLPAMYMASLVRCPDSAPLLLLPQSATFPLLCIMAQLYPEHINASRLLMTMSCGTLVAASVTDDDQVNAAVWALRYLAAAVNDAFHSRHMDHTRVMEYAISMLTNRTCTLTTPECDSDACVDKLTCARVLVRPVHSFLPAASVSCCSTPWYFGRALCAFRVSKPTCNTCGGRPRQQSRCAVRLQSCHACVLSITNAPPILLGTWTLTTLHMPPADVAIAGPLRKPAPRCPGAR
jgi:hypothetical protein